MRLCVCMSNWNIAWNGLTKGIFIRCHLVLNKCGSWCSLISACSICSVWALFAGSVPQRLLKEPLHLCQGQVEICCTLLIGQSAFQTLSHHAQIRLSYRPGVNRGFFPSLFPSCSLLHPLVTFRFFLCCVAFLIPYFLVARGNIILVLHTNYKKGTCYFDLAFTVCCGEKFRQKTSSQTWINQKYFQVI